jgi:hypothetical protein
MVAYVCGSVNLGLFPLVTFEQIRDFVEFNSIQFMFIYVQT